MAPKFGTSGLRGLVTELTPDLVSDYTAAFLAACDTGTGLFVGRDLRPSSPRIAEDVIAAARAAGVAVTDCGVLPTPALALAAGDAGAGAVMVTGSHIPADRNGLKFYTPRGEIGKDEEQAIGAARGTTPAAGTEGPLERTDAAAAYAARYVTAYGAKALTGLTLGIYQHSSVARDVLVAVTQALGATAIPLARSEDFIPVDTEAVDGETRAMLAGWCADHGLDAVLSTDGDADRPMLTDATGRVIPGDVLGALTARALGAGILCTPVSSNSQVELMPDWQVVRTRIGSPHVIAAMEDHPGRTVGYEANGGFLLGFEAEGPAGPLPPLVTRDCLLPMLAPLSEAVRQGRTLADLAAALPPRFTAADRLQGIEAAVSGPFIDRLAQDAAARADFFEAGAETGTDLTDGLRVSFEGGRVVHLRPSGNAPETRVYTEADTPEAAEELLARHLVKLAAALRTDT